MPLYPPSSRLPFFFSFCFCLPKGYKPDVLHAYYYQEYNNNVHPDYGYAADINVDDMLGTDTEKDAFVDERNYTSTESDSLQARADSNRVISRSKYWPAAQVSLPKGKLWQGPDSVDYGTSPGEPFMYSYDKRAQSGQYVYVVGEAGAWTTHDVSAILCLVFFPVRWIITMDS
jgi:hypothetical protein